MHKLLKKLIIAGVITTSIYAPTSVRATEVPVKYDLVSTADAVKGAIPVTLYFGKIISLDFTDAEEYITFVAPSEFALNLSTIPIYLPTLVKLKVSIYYPSKN